jgi:hypothetical protein
MTIFRVEPVLDPKTRGLCRLPYPGHPKGCPNYGKKDRCPPKSPLWRDVYDLEAPTYAVVSEFPLGPHMARMKAAHPYWSLKQCRNVLYWQGTARKALREKIFRAVRACTDRPSGIVYQAEETPEAMGVNVFATMEKVGIILEHGWPATIKHVALLGRPLVHPEGQLKFLQERDHEHRKTEGPTGVSVFSDQP